MAGMVSKLANPTAQEFKSLSRRLHCFQRKQSWLGFEHNQYTALVRNRRFVMLQSVHNGKVSIINTKFWKYYYFLFILFGDKIYGFLDRILTISQMRIKSDFSLFYNSQTNKR
jgi:hypothetical protein